MRPLFVLALASLTAAPLAAQQPADVVYTNATVWTGVAGAPRAEALAVRDGVLVAVGAADAVARHADPGTRVVDLAGAFVVPGFIDNHTHFLSGGMQLASVDLRSAPTPDEFTARLAEYAADLPDGRWITGGDWDHEAWGGELPRRQWIDAVTADHFVFVNRLDGHMALANTRTLEAAGITAATPDPEGGTIVRDPDTGEPTGVLKDAAMDLVYGIMPETGEEELDRALGRATEHALSLGVTQVHDVGSFGGWTDLATYERAAARGDLGVRVYALVPLATWERMRDRVAERGTGDDHLRWGGLKGFVDGSLGSTTAWFYDPYLDEPGTSGFPVTDLDELRADVLGADAAGLHVAVHAIGDRANDWLLDVFAEAAERHGARDRRFRIEHAQHLTREAIARFDDLGVIPSMQPYHAIDDGRWAGKRIGKRVRTTYPFRSLLDAGAALTFGSDWTVAPLDPLEGIYGAVTRRTIDGANPGGWVPEERITVEQALVAYTAANARAGFQEARVGTLEPGKLADFVVLSADLLAIDPVDIPDVRVLRTVVGGVERFTSH